MRLHFILIMNPSSKMIKLWLPPISVIRDPQIKNPVGIWRFASVNHALFIWCYRNSALIFKKYGGHLGQHGCFLFSSLVGEWCICLCRGWASIDGSHTDCLSSCVLNWAIPVFHLRTLLDVAQLLSLLLRSMSSTACSFIYANLCNSFFTYRPFVLLFPVQAG